jgi:hypothetical protein
MPAAAARGTKTLCPSFAFMFGCFACSDRGLGWVLAFANVALAGAPFAEPVLFGRIIDSLAHVQRRSVLSWPTLLPLVGAWVGFGLFMKRARGAPRGQACPQIAPGGAHRVLRARAWASLELPRSDSFGQLMKVMLSGTGDGHGAALFACMSRNRERSRSTAVTFARSSSRVSAGASG